MRDLREDCPIEEYKNRLCIERQNLRANTIVMSSLVFCNEIKMNGIEKNTLTFVIKKEKNQQPIQKGEEI